jgi:hypothetical protein
VQLKRPIYEVAVIQPPHGRIERVSTLHDVGVLIRDGVMRVTGLRAWELHVEAPHISRRNPATGLQLATTIGKLVGPMEANTGKARLHQPAEWRSEVLGLPASTQRDRAKRVSLYEMPRRLPLLRPMLEAACRLQGVPKKKLDHVTDAAGVAEYGYLIGTQEHDDDDDAA